MSPGWWTDYPELPGELKINAAPGLFPIPVSGGLKALGAADFLVDITFRLGFGAPFTPGNFRLLFGQRTRVAPLDLILLREPSWSALRDKLALGWVAVGVVVWLLFAFWGAAKIFRIGILMTGKPPKIREVLGWLRAPVGAVPARRDELATQ